jgi:phage terminase large subunit GpA-like protein
MRMPTISLERAWLEGFRPAPALTVADWAAQYRRLPEASAARGARWRNETAPCLVDVMNAATEPGVKQIAVVKAAQVGVSEALSNALGYFMHHRPAPMLMVLPTASAAGAYAKERLADMLRSTPELRAIVTDKRVPSEAGLPESTLSLKLFPGGFLTLAGANSPNSFARWSVRVAIADDCDRIPRFVGAEGDPTQLLINRTTSFHDGLTIFVSTPVLAGGRIETLFGQSDQRRYFLPCVKCHREHDVTWNDPTRWRVVYDDAQPSSARLECPCGHRVYEPERLDLIREGRWRPTTTPIASGYVGFHLPAMLSPFITLSALVTKWLAAQGGTPRRLREFVTTQLAEGWKDEATSIDENDLLARREDY